MKKYEKAYVILAKTEHIVFAANENTNTRYELHTKYGKMIKILRESSFEHDLIDILNANTQEDSEFKDYIVAKYYDLELAFYTAKKYLGINS